MEYASKVMNPTKILEKVAENCSSANIQPPSTRSFNPTASPFPTANDNEEDSLIIYPFGLHHRTSPSSSVNSSFSTSCNTSPTSLSPRYNFYEVLWGPQSTFWITLIFFTLLGLGLTTCCILKQRYDHHFNNRYQVSRSPRNGNQNSRKRSQKVAAISLPLENLVNVTSTEVSREIPTTTSCIFGESPVQVILGTEAEETEDNSGIPSNGCIQPSTTVEIIQHV